MSKPHGWNHVQCYPCWYARWSHTREPARVHDPEEQSCCFCGRPTASGIFIRLRPGDGTIPNCPDSRVKVSPLWHSDATHPAR